MRSRAFSFKLDYPLLSLRSSSSFLRLLPRLLITSIFHNVVVFPFAFHIAVQQPFKPLWSRLLLYELEPSRASFAVCFKPLLITLLPASVLVSVFVWCLHFDLSSKGGPASSYATAGTSLRVTGVLKPPHHDKVEPPMRRLYYHRKEKRR